MDKTAIDIWEKVVDNLTLSIGNDSVNLWIKPLKPLSLAENVLTLSVPNIFFSQWIEKNQQYNIEQILSGLCSAQGQA